MHKERISMDISKVSILVVDDVNTMQVQIKELLKAFGFVRITTCGSGEEAAAILESDSFNLLLCDWHMEPGDGMELLQFIRSHPIHRESAFIMVTAENTKDSVVQAIQAGVDDFLVKPLTASIVADRVMKVLKKRRVLS